MITNIFLTSLNPCVLLIPIDARPTAPVPPPPETVTVGAVPNPIPPSDTTYLRTPLPDVFIEQVAATPVPPPPVNAVSYTHLTLPTTTPV